MSSERKEIFISYRRSVSEFTARLIKDNLPDPIYEVFYDIESLHTGEFEEIIFRKISSCDYFILIIDKTTLDRCIDVEDILRREIETALALHKNIIPIYVNNIPFIEIEPLLVGNLKELRRWNGIPLVNFYFPAFVTILRRNFLGETLVGNSVPSDDTTYLELASKEYERNSLKSEKERRELELERLALVVMNDHLRDEMHTLKETIEALEIVGANCPLCEHSLTEDERTNLIEKVISDGRSRGNSYRANVARTYDIDARLSDLEAVLGDANANLSAHP